MQGITAVLITKKERYPFQETGIYQLDFDEVIVSTESPNVYQRYVQASKARNDIIFVQDDDAIVDYKALFKHYNGQLTNGITPHHYNAYKDTGATLVGWGCFFPKKMLDVFSKYIDKYGEDFHLFREADRIFTVLNQPHNTIIMEHEDLPQTADRMSLEEMHYVWAKEAIAKTKLVL